MMKTLLVGGGITSSLISFFLHYKPGITTIDIWEKDNYIGGRMRSVSSKYSEIPIDIGAQYLTTDKIQSNPHDIVYKSLLDQNIIQELNAIIKNFKQNNENHKNYVASKGTSSLIQHFLSTSENNLCLNHNLKILNLNDQKIEAETTEGLKKTYDAVIITIPVPDILHLSGNFLTQANQDTVENLRKIKFSSRYVLVLVYHKRIKEEWAAFFTPNDDLIRYISIQEKKVNIPSNQCSVIIHSATNFDERFAANTKEDIQFMLIDRVKQLFPDWGLPVDVLFYKWNYSQVISPLQTASKILVLSAKPSIILAGDSFSASNFNCCIESAKNAAEFLLKTYVTS